MIIDPKAIRSSLFIGNTPRTADFSAGLKSALRIADYAGAIFGCTAAGFSTALATFEQLTCVLGGLALFYVLWGVCRA